MSNQSYKGTHRHRPPLGWHPPRSAPESMDADGNGQLTESTEPFTPTFTGEFSALPTAEPVLIEKAQPQAALVPDDRQYLKRWTFVLVVAGVWIVSAAIGLGLYYWWFQSIDKTPPVFVLLIFLVVVTVGSLIAAMVQEKPLMSAVSVALMSAPFAAVGAAAVLHGTYFCDHVARCLVGVIPY